jgi:hypothetical protein
MRLGQASVGMRLARWSALLALAASLALSGCLSDSGASLAGIPEGQPASGPNAGSPANHGTPQRGESAVTVTGPGLLGGTQYVASKTITITNDFGGASQATVSLSTGAGGVTTRDWNEGGYKLVALLQARAPSESQARSALSAMVLEHTDRLSGDTLTLASVVRSPSNPAPGVSYSGTLAESLPRQPAYSISLNAGSGGATSQGLNGPSIDADTGSGGISIDGRFGRLTASAGSGGVDLSGTANEVRADTGSGGISARLRAGGSGSWDFDTGSGGVDLAIVRGGNDGYDVEASAGSGNVDVDLSDGQALGTQRDNHAHVRSSGYSDAAIQVRVTATAGSGGIAIDD